MMARSVSHRMIGMLSSLFLLFTVSDMIAQTRSQMQVLLDDDRRSAHLSIAMEGGVVYGSLSELADLVGIRNIYNPQNKKWVLRAGSSAITVTQWNPFIVIDDHTYQMALPPIHVDNNTFVPLAIFLEIVAPYMPAIIALDPQQRTLKIRKYQFNITAVEIEDRSNGTLIRIITTKQFSESDIAVSITRDWLNVTLNGGSLDSTFIASDRKQGIVNQIVPFLFESSAQLSFLLDKEVIDKKIDINPKEVIITLWNRADVDIAALSAVDNRKRWLIDRVILDPGHGGKDPGAIGKNGTKEKEINLDIARRLKALIEKKLNIDVLMTREGDELPGLKERTRFANTNDGKLFISIHCNANASKSVRGFSTYILGPARTEQALQVAEKENSVIEFEDSQEEYKDFQNAAHILNAIHQSTNLKESEDLARMVNESMKKWTKIPQWGNGVYQAGFYVLIGAAMPRIFVETAFISNAYEERLLRTRSFRQKIAEALCESIEKFKEKYEKGV